MFEIVGQCDGLEVEVRDEKHLDGHVEGLWGWVGVSFPYDLVPDDLLEDDDPIAWAKEAAVRVDDDRLLLWVDPKGPADPIIFEVTLEDGEVVARRYGTDE